MVLELTRRQDTVCDAKFYYWVNAKQKRGGVVFLFTLLCYNPRMELTFVTGNLAKAKYLADYFHIPVVHRKLDLPEIQSLDLRAIVEDKARRAYEAVLAPVLVEDTSLTFHAFKALPGPLIKWHLETLGNEGLCQLLNGHQDRSAHAEVMFAYCDEEGVRIFHGEAHGTIAPSPRGETDFGWDPIFIPNGYKKTWAEMTGDEKHATSMRKPALEALAAHLHNHRSALYLV